MIRTLFTVIFSLSYSFSSCLAEENFTALKINIICEPRAGLDRDRNILKNALRALDCEVNCFGTEELVPEANINIFCQTLNPDCFLYATYNWFIPNPEWYTQDMHLLNDIDLILCRTREVERIFTALGKKTYFMGFTSLDCYDPYYTKNYEFCLHLPGTSWQKGTEPLLNAWKKHSEFPHLSIIRFPENERSVPENVDWINYWIPEPELRKLQNECGIHFCLSESEGFGHYIMEAMSVGAVVIATDAPPMNEFITDQRCLVPFKAWRLQCLGTNYHIDVADIESRVKEILTLPPSELKRIGKANRNNFKRWNTLFLDKLEQLISRYQNLNN